MLEPKLLIAALRQTLGGHFEMPLRHHHFYQTETGTENTMILMPSWTNKYLGVKQVIVAPENAGSGLPTISALYTLFDAASGRPLAMMDAGYMTSVRTACTSALAADYLARADAKTLLVVGTGKVAFQLVRSHSLVRNYEQITIWGRTPSRAAEMSAQLNELGYNVSYSADLAGAVRSADVIACATMAEHPLIKGEWLQQGQHLDLVGAYKPWMREVDDEAVLKASLFVDSRAGALKEAGDLYIPLTNKRIQENYVAADIVELCCGKHPGRQFEKEITLFKSVGMAVEDLSAALLAYGIIQGGKDILTGN